MGLGRQQAWGLGSPLLSLALALVPKPTPFPHIYALRKGGLQRSGGCFCEVFAESRTRLGTQVTESNRAKDRVITPTSVQSTAWFGNSGGRMGMDGHFGTLKGCITRA